MLNELPEVEITELSSEDYSEVIEIAGDDADPLTLFQASTYFFKGLVIADTASRATKSAIASDIGCIGCTSFCASSRRTTRILTEVGNDIVRTKAAIVHQLDLGLRCSCEACCDRHFGFAGALQQHLVMLVCLSVGDNQGVIAAAVARGEELDRLCILIG